MPKGKHNNHARGAANGRWTGGFKLKHVAEYRSWTSMRNRCLNPNAIDWAYYGGRGILVSPRWNKYKNFIADMGRKPGPKYTLERKNTNGNYKKSNCIWATRQTQARNRAYVKLSVDKAAAIRAAYSSGVIQEELAQAYGVSQSLISHIIRGRAWRQEVEV